MTPVLARDLRARDIAVNAIAPALERPGAAADIATLVAFLVSEDVRWVNGRVTGRMAPSVAKPRATDQGFDGREARREAPR
jgi:NAD(P)-dependent dehydrogenase (short-subunit alcohol dehydrogenase family)